MSQGDILRALEKGPMNTTELRVRLVNTGKISLASMQANMRKMKSHNEIAKDENGKWRLVV